LLNYITSRHPQPDGVEYDAVSLTSGLSETFNFAQQQTLSRAIGTNDHSGRTW
jgi:hypothetical protein